MFRYVSPFGVGGRDKAWYGEKGDEFKIPVISVRIPYWKLRVYYGMQTMEQPFVLRI
jgi:hypothetical protein